jgi:hypothetical protein
MAVHHYKDHRAGILDPMAAFQSIRLREWTLYGPSRLVNT